MCPFNLAITLVSDVGAQSPQGLGTAFEYPSLQSLRETLQGVQGYGP